MQTFSFIPPIKELQKVVKNVFVVEQGRLDGLVQPLSFYADGCPGLIFQQTENDCLLYNQKRKMSSFFLYGQTVYPVELLPSGSYRMIVFTFYPHILKSLFNIRAGELTDTCVDVNLLHIEDTHSTIDALQNTVTAEDQVKSINQFLLRLMRTNEANADCGFQDAITWIAGNNADTSLKELRTYLNITERTFERKFEHNVGISPKLFLRICRFRASLQQISERNFNKLSDVAYENGYADQSHFIRSFKEFTGLSPLEYHKLETATKDTVSLM